jgi:lipoic acid synthetase
MASTAMPGPSVLQDPPRPEWLRVRLRTNENFLHLAALLRDAELHTVCEEARCPNISECWGEGTATFMVLGDICTWRCAYCAVTTGRPGAVDPWEPARLARVVKQLGLQYVVVTSVTRDDLPDGGAAHFAAVIRAIRHQNPGCGIEVLIPDLKGSRENLEVVLAARPDVLNHNIETVPRLFRRVRPRGRYERSLQLIRWAKEMGAFTKSGIIVGMADLRAHGCDVLTIGQYLRPSAKHLPVARYYHPEEFAALAEKGRAMGFQHVEAGPLVRSSYMAHRYAPALHTP